MRVRSPSLSRSASLRKRAWDAGVQVMVEGPGHMALDEIAANMKLEKRLCHNAPLLRAGAPCYGYRPRIRPYHGSDRRRGRCQLETDFLCYVTPAEHLRLPDVNDVREGLVATKIAAHAADIAKACRARATATTL